MQPVDVFILSSLEEERVRTGLGTYPCSDRETTITSLNDRFYL